MRRLLPIAAIVIGVGCSGSRSSGPSGPRFASAEDHFSIVEPEGWTASRELGSVVFSPPAGQDDRVTIAIRTVPLDDRGEAPLTDEEIVAATERTLASLPSARVTNRKEVEAGGLSGVAFDLSFVPPSHRGQRYERRHVVLVGQGQIIHVLHTAPAGHLGGTAVMFDRIVSSVREEG